MMLKMRKHFTMWPDNEAPEKSFITGFRIFVQNLNRIVNIGCARSNEVVIVRQDWLPIRKRHFLCAEIRTIIMNRCKNTHRLNYIYQKITQAKFALIRIKWTSEKLICFIPFIFLIFAADKVWLGRDSTDWLIFHYYISARSHQRQKDPNERRNQWNVCLFFLFL